jgi:hypothetical protein
VNPPKLPAFVMGLGLFNPVGGLVPVGLALARSGERTSGGADA